MIFRQPIVTSALMLGMGASALFLAGERNDGVSFVLPRTLSSSAT
jgi:hypothetical protein